jgi:hypothetical protein
MPHAASSTCRYAPRLIFNSVVTRHHETEEANKATSEQPTTNKATSEHPTTNKATSEQSTTNKATSEQPR